MTDTQHMPADWAIAQVVREMAATGQEGNSLTTRMQGQQLLQKAREVEANVAREPR